MNENDIYLSTNGTVYIVTIANKTYRINMLFYKVLYGIKSGMSINESIRRVSTDTGVEYDLLFNKFNVFFKTVQQNKIKNSYICESAVGLPIPFIENRLA